MVEVGQKVSVSGLNGTVKFIGETHFAAGTWCGVDLDDKAGKNDGSVNGARYFYTAKVDGLYGLFARLEAVQSLNSEEQNPESLFDAQMNTKLQKLVFKLQDKIYDMHAKYLELQNRFQYTENLEVKLESCIIDKEALLLESEQLANELSTLKDEHGNALEQLNELREEIHLRRSIDVEEWTSQASSETLWKRNRLLQATLVKLQGSLDSSRELNDDLEFQNQALSKEHDRVISELESISRELENSHRMIESLNSQLDSEVSYDHIVDKLTQENTDLSTKLDSLKETIDELSSERVVANDLQRIYNDLEDELSEQLHILREDIQKAQRTISILEAEKLELSKELTSQEAGANESQLLELTAQVNDLHLELYKKALNEQYLREGLATSDSESSLQLSRRLSFLSHLLKQEVQEKRPLHFQGPFFLDLAAQYYESVYRLTRSMNLAPEKFTIYGSNQIEDWKEIVFNGQTPQDLLDYAMNPFLNQETEVVGRDASLLFGFLKLSSANILNLDERLSETLRSALLKLCAVCEEKLINLAPAAVGLIETHCVFTIISSFFDRVILPLSDDDLYQDKVASFVDDLNSKISLLEFIEIIPHHTQSPNSYDQPGGKLYQNEVNEVNAELDGMNQVVYSKQLRIEELELKLKVYESKIERQMLQENTILELQNELLDLKQCKKTLKSSISSLEARNAELIETLEAERVRHNFLLPNQRLLSLSRDLNGVNQLDLISQISDLQYTILREEEVFDVLEKNQWLIEPLKTDAHFLRNDFFDKLNLTRRSFSHFLSSAEVVPVNFKPQNSSVLSYYCNKLEEKKRRANSLFENLVEP